MMFSVFYISISVKNEEQFIWLPSTACFLAPKLVCCLKLSAK